MAGTELYTYTTRSSPNLDQRLAAPLPRDTLNRTPLAGVGPHQVCWGELDLIIEPTN